MSFSLQSERLYNFPVVLCEYILRSAGLASLFLLVHHLHPFWSDSAPGGFEGTFQINSQRSQAFCYSEVTVSRKRILVSLQVNPVHIGATTDQPFLDQGSWQTLNAIQISDDPFLRYLCRSPVVIPVVTSLNCRTYCKQQSFMPDETCLVGRGRHLCFFSTLEKFSFCTEATRHSKRTFLVADLGIISI